MSTSLVKRHLQSIVLESEIWDAPNKIFLIVLYVVAACLPEELIHVSANEGGLACVRSG